MSIVLRITRVIAARSFILQQCRNLNSLDSKANNLIPPVVNLALNHQSNSWIWRQEDQLGLPITNIIKQLPNNILWIPPVGDNGKLITEISEPCTNNHSIEAARLIVIRRKKMKKHKLRKLRKKMKYEWAKVRQRRELKKEKEFQAVLIQQCKEAEKFSAEQYVQARLDKLNETPIKKSWKYTPPPEFLNKS